MKTPRELLLERHEAVGPKLEAIRREVIARLGETNRPAYRTSSRWQQFWQELFWSCRRIWAGLAAVWVVLLVINLAQRDPAAARRAQSPPSVATVIMLRDQEKMLNELLADRSMPAEAARPREFVPKPRSAAGGITAV